MCGVRGPIEEERLACFCAGSDEVSGLLDVQLCEVGLSNPLVDGEVLIVPAEGHTPHSICIPTLDKLFQAKIRCILF